MLQSSTVLRNTGDIPHGYETSLRPFNLPYTALLVQTLSIVAMRQRNKS